MAHIIRARCTGRACLSTDHTDAHAVPDPYYGDESDFNHALDLVEDACRGLLEATAAHD